MSWNYVCNGKLSSPDVTKNVTFYHEMSRFGNLRSQKAENIKWSFDHEGVLEKIPNRNVAQKKIDRDKKKTVFQKNIKNVQKKCRKCSTKKNSLKKTQTFSKYFVLIKNIY